jgi:hypothetical protein
MLRLALELFVGALLELRDRGERTDLHLHLDLLLLGHGRWSVPNARPGYPRPMLIAAIVGICVLLLILGFLVPRLSRGPQRGVDKALTGGQGVARKAPGPLGRLLSKPFGTSRRAANRSASAGRRARGKV